MKKSGGKRKSSGRNKLPARHKKETVPLYIEGTKIDIIGGEQRVKDICYNSIEQAAQAAWELGKP